MNPIRATFDAAEVRRLCRAAATRAASQHAARPAARMLLIDWARGLRLGAPGTGHASTFAIGWEEWAADLEPRMEAKWGRGRPALLLSAQHFAAADDPECIAVEVALDPAEPPRFSFVRRVADR